MSNNGMHTAAVLDSKEHKYHEYKTMAVGIVVSEGLEFILFIFLKRDRIYIKHYPCNKGGYLYQVIAVQAHFHR